MCYGSNCENEIRFGPKAGECRGGRNIYCPPYGEICNMCGTDTESDEPVCDGCKESMKKGEIQ